jgi:uncharacterized protein
MLRNACGIHKVAWILLFIGGINWGLVGAFEFDLVARLLGAWPIVLRIVYVLVGLAALSMLGYGKCCGKNCNCVTKK